jgi:hypothetical protein
MRLTPLRMLLIPASLIALVGLLTPGIYLHHLRQQRVLQDQLETIEYVSLQGHGDHWLTEWLPERWSSLLPKTQLNVVIIDATSIAPCIPLCHKLEGINNMAIYFDSEFQEQQWQLVTDQPQLHGLSIHNAPLGDAHIHTLARHHELRDVNLTNVPISNATLNTFAGMLNLEHLVLYDTAISVDAIETYAKAHPNVTVGWRAPATNAQADCAKTLHAFGVLAAYRYPHNQVALEPEWTLYVESGVMLTPEAWACLQGLGGTVDTVVVDDWLSPEVLDLIYHLPDVVNVNLSGGPISTEDVDRLATLSTIKWIEYDYGAFTDEQVAELYKRWGKKVPPPRNGTGTSPAPFDQPCTLRLPPSPPAAQPSINPLPGRAATRAKNHSACAGCNAFALFVKLFTSSGTLVAFLPTKSPLTLGEMRKYS